MLQAVSNKLQFSAVVPKIQAEYVQFIKDKVCTDSLNLQAFLFIDSYRREEGTKKRGAHDDLGLEMVKNKYTHLAGIRTFVRELQQLLVATGRIPSLIGAFRSEYRLNETYKKMSKSDAEDRFDSFRAAVGEFTKPYRAAMRQAGLIW